MQSYNVDGLNFDFPEEWKVSKYDGWSFYRNHFAKMWNGIKAVDLLAVDSFGASWLIEVKDYRIHQRTKPSELGEELAYKVFDTLAAMLPAKVHAHDLDEKRMASFIAGCGEIHVILHIEQPRKHSKLFPRAINPAHVQQKIRQLLKPIDAHPKVVEMSAMQSLGWSVS